MTRQDWLTACVVAIGMTALTVSLIAPPLCWADGEAKVVVPALPATALTIPSINAEVTATAAFAAGRDVEVCLLVKAPSGTDLTQVPVTVAVQKTDMNVMSRSMPMPEEVAKVEATVPVGPDGTGSVMVKLPLVWAAPPPAPKPVEKAVPYDAEMQKYTLVENATRFQMVLSSTLGGQRTAVDVEYLQAATTVLREIKAKRAIPNISVPLLINTPQNININQPNPLEKLTWQRWINTVITVKAA